jgi:hypothetical protein
VPDLIDRSKVASAAAVTFVAGAEDLRGREADLVVIDLSRVNDLDVLRTIESPRIIGFGRHDDRDRLAAGRASGCTEVFARSAFFSRVGQLLAE